MADAQCRENAAESPDWALVFLHLSFPRSAWECRLRRSERPRNELPISACGSAPCSANDDITVRRLSAFEVVKKWGQAPCEERISPVNQGSARSQSPFFPNLLPRAGDRARLVLRVPRSRWAQQEHLPCPSLPGAGNAHENGNLFRGRSERGNESDASPRATPQGLERPPRGLPSTSPGNCPCCRERRNLP